MSKACDHALTNLYLYLDREVGGFARWRMKRHLHQCPPCGKAFVFEERLRQVIRERLREEVPDQVVFRIVEVIRREREQR
jgi:mycothiol system anti-sigma-R factor